MLPGSQVAVLPGILKRSHLNKACSINCLLISMYLFPAAHALASFAFAVLEQSDFSAQVVYPTAGPKCVSADTKESTPLIGVPDKVPMPEVTVWSVQLAEAPKPTLIPLAPRLSLLRSFKTESACMREDMAIIIDETLFPEMTERRDKIGAESCRVAFMVLSLTSMSSNLDWIESRVLFTICSRIVSFVPFSLRVKSKSNMLLGPYGSGGLKHVSTMFTIMTPLSPVRFSSIAGAISPNIAPSTSSKMRQELASGTTKASMIPPTRNANIA
mmetsp:Transcript_28731/g.61018  ORF Transcript_28731/g.61018 Transcript_28731/m.61018 type:complete len:271 (+) Transcript_28731:700-1512(+)